MEKTFKPSENLSSSIFFTFLKQNNAYDSFKRNFADPGLCHGIVNLDYVSPDYYLAGAFYWATTPEGLDYWKLIDSKWQHVVYLFKL